MASGPPCRKSSASASRNALLTNRRVASGEPPGFPIDVRWQDKNEVGLAARGAMLRARSRSRSTVRKSPRMRGVVRFFGLLPASIDRPPFDLNYFFLAEISEYLYQPN